MFETVVDRKIRIAVVGCGRVSKNHFKSIEMLKEDRELIAVCDISLICWMRFPAS